MAYIKKADRMPQGPSNELDDDDLGIGEPLADEPVAATADTGEFSALLENPVFIAALVKKLGVLGGVAPASAGSDLEFLASRLERAIGARDEQRPGYAIPLTANQKQSRADGYAKMKGLIDRNKRDNIWPAWLTGEQGWHGPSAAGPMRYDGGQQVNWRGPPAEDFTPLNRPAAEVYAAYKQWIGEAADVETLLLQAHIALNGGGKAVPQTVMANKGAEDVQIVEAARVDLSSKRAMTAGIGANVSHPHLQPPGQSAPLGPTYVEAA